MNFELQALMADNRTPYFRSTRSLMMEDDANFHLSRMRMSKRLREKFHNRRRLNHNHALAQTQEIENMPVAVRVDDDEDFHFEGNEYHGLLVGAPNSGSEDDGDNDNDNEVSSQSQNYLLI